MNIIEDFKKGNRRILVVSELLADEELASREGQFCTEKDFPICIRENCDVYGMNPDGELQPVLKFRKAVIPKTVCDVAFRSLERAAKRHTDNRGAAAGVIDPTKLSSHVKNMDDVAGRFYINNYRNNKGQLIKASLSNTAQSNIIGFYDKANRKLGKDAPPCRLTTFTANQTEKWENTIPLLEHADKQFKTLFPKHHAEQYKKAHETEFVIADTAFSTVTINYNWRTALHRDNGDYRGGFGNLLVLERGVYKGGCTGFPRYGVCVDVRHGDFLAMDVHDWHANTPIVGVSDDYARLSVVCYLRENMHRCKGIKVKDSIRASQLALQHKK